MSIIKNKRTIIVSIVVILLGFIFLLIYNFFIYLPWVNELKFVEYKGYIANSKNDNYVLNLPFTENIIWGDKSKDIIKVNIEPASDSIFIDSFEIMEGEILNKYRVNTLLLDLSFKNDGKYKINYLIITFKNGKTEKINLENITFNIVEYKQKKYIIQNSSIPVSQSFAFYELDLRNKTNSIIDIVDIEIGEELMSDFKPYQIDPNTSDLKRIDLKNVSEASEFYIIKPVLECEINDSAFFYLPEATMYGTMAIDKEKMERIITK